MELETPAEIVVVSMDAILMEQVLFNLMENAVLHAEGMTRLGLRVTVLGEQVCFEVTDNGRGLSPGRLADPFTMAAVIPAYIYFWVLYR